MKVMEAFAKIFGRRDKNKNPLVKKKNKQQKAFLSICLLMGI